MARLIYSSAGAAELVRVKAHGSRLHHAGEAGEVSGLPTPRRIRLARSQLHFSGPARSSKQVSRSSPTAGWEGVKIHYCVQRVGAGKLA